MNAEQLDVCRNLAESANKAMKSKRLLRILSGLRDDGMIDYDPFSCTATLTEAGSLAVTNGERADG